jgi:hypothetical protein
MSRFLGPWRRFFLQATDAPHEYCEAAGLMCLSNIAIGRRELEVGRGIRPNMFMMLAGDSSVARKSTSVNFCKLMTEEVEPDRVGPRDYTVEGLLKWMAEKDPATKKGRNKVVLFAEEFGSDLARIEAYASTMPTDFCALYDGESFEKIRSGSAPLSVERPRVNLFAAAAYQMLSSHLKAKDWLNGFLMRFVYVAPTVATMRQKNYLAPTWPQRDYDSARVALTVLRDDIVRARFMRLPFSPAAKQEMTKWSMSVDTFAAGLQDSLGAKHTYVSRFSVNVQKMALLYQLDDDPNAPVGINAVRQALEFAGQVCWPSFAHVYERTTSDDFMATLSTALAALREGPMMKRDLETRFRSRVVRAVIDHLVWSGHAVLTKGENGELLTLK